MTLYRPLAGSITVAFLPVVCHSYMLLDSAMRLDCIRQGCGEQQDLQSPYLAMSHYDAALTYAVFDTMLAPFALHSDLHAHVLCVELPMFPGD